jgi:phage shock protein PspC (stress-responsive transcriptional regulator)
MAPGAPIPRLRRTRQGAIWAGVCAGVARATGVDVNLVRLVVVAGHLAGGFVVVA